MQSQNFRARSVNSKDMGMGKGLNDQNWNEKSGSTDAIQLWGEFIEILENSAKENEPKRGKK